MYEYIVTIILGILLIIIGSLNTKGNISSLHYYHRKRVTEDTQIPFGKKVGLGTIIIGCSMVFFSILLILAELFNTDIYATIANIVIIFGLTVGLSLNFYAMIKYNKGIF